MYRYDMEEDFSMKQTITDITVDNKRVFVRADFNVPLDGDCRITDDTRIQKTLPTIKYLLDHHAAVILASHLGRPKGEAVPKYSLKPVAERLSELLGIRPGNESHGRSAPARRSPASRKPSLS